MTDKEKEQRARRTIVNVLSREHQAMISRRAAAAGDLAAEKARLEALEAEWKREGSLMGPGFGGQERRIEGLKQELERAEHNAKCTAEAMEYIALHFVDQLEKAP
jgi:hypothetical protein